MNFEMYKLFSHFIDYYGTVTSINEYHGHERS